MYSFVFLLCLCHTIMAITKVEHLRLSIRQQVLLQTLQMKADVAELKNLIENQNTKIAELKNVVEHQNTKNAELKNVVEHQNTKNAELKNVVEHQNTKISELKNVVEHQNTKIANQNTKMCKLEAEIEKLINHQVVTTTTAATTPITTATPPITTATTPITTATTPITTATPPITTASSTSETSSGVVFTRWGRRDCPAGISTPVYNGTVGGSYDVHTGAAVNYLCMPNQPTWDNNKLFKPAESGYVYSGVYDDLPDSSLTYQFATCAVCRAELFSTKVMIPGRDTCFPGWTKAYSGELVSGYHGYTAATEYACLDKHPQKAGSGGIFGFHLYSVLARCGFSYQNEAVLTCVVCLK